MKYLLYKVNANFFETPLKYVLKSKSQILKNE